MTQLSGYPWDAVRALDLPAEDYVVFGSAPLLANGLIKEVGDIDLLAIRSAWRAAQVLGIPVLAPSGDRVVHLAPDIDIFDGWLGLEAEAVIRRAELLDGLPIAHLGDVAAYKRLLDRPKDRLHMKLIEAHLSQVA